MDHFMAIYLLLVTLASFAYCERVPTGKCQDGETKSNDEFKMICCSGDWHVTERSLPFYRSCDIEPSDPNLSYEDSSWLAYNCLLRKSLWPNKLSLRSYATFVSGVSESRLGDLFDEEPLQNATNDDRDAERGGVETTKSYFSQYFRAVQEICNHGYNQTDSFSGNNQTGKPAIKSALDTARPGRVCSNGVVPRMNESSRRPNYDYLDSNRCVEKLKALLGNATSDEIFRDPRRYCWHAPQEGLEVEDIPRTTSEFETFVALLWPSSWSQGVKKNATQDLIGFLKLKFDITVDSNVPELVFPAFLNLIRKDLRSALKEGERMISEDTVVHGILASEILSWSQHIRQYAACRRPTYLSFPFSNKAMEDLI